jgi:hypothetical protein
MNPVSRATVRCTRCGASGVVAQGVVCTLCGGAGEYRRLVVPLKILGVGDLLSDRGMSFHRMAVLLAEHIDDGKVLLRGVTDRGVGLVTSMAADRFGKTGHEDFVETTTWWAP